MADNAFQAINDNVIRLHRDLRDFERTTQASFAHVSAKQDSLKSEVDDLYEKFIQFLKDDLKHKTLQLAETRVGNLKQDLQIKFGYYAEIRRMTTGMLNGADTGTVSQETMKFVSEEVLLKAPKYWLAPALVAMASWFRDDRLTSESALREALKRDDYKTTLLFLLLMRRLGRDAAVESWGDRYFLHQNPKSVQREFIIVLEGISMGAFPASLKTKMIEHMAGWLESLSAEGDFIQKQNNKWINFFKTKGNIQHLENYPLLAEYSENWDHLKTDITHASASVDLMEFFTTGLNPDQENFSDTSVLLDEILENLVSNFDDEELPLQKEVRLNELIIEFKGDEDRARVEMSNEESSFEEVVDFLTLLSNAAFNPDKSGASKATQILAISVSQPWILSGYRTFVAEYRSNKQTIFKLKIEDWTAETKDAKNEGELQDSILKYAQKKEVEELKKVPNNYFAIIAGLLIGFWFLANKDLGSTITVFALGIIIQILVNSNVKKKRQKITETWTEKKSKFKNIVGGIMAEVTMFLEEFRNFDKNSNSVTDIIESIKSENFASKVTDTPREIITK